MKKKSMIVILFLSITFSILSQERNNPYSIEINCNYIYYDFNTTKNDFGYKNQFNYGFSVLFSKQLSNKIKFGIGASFMTKNAYYEVEPTSFNDYLTKVEYHIQNFSIPFQVNYAILDLPTFKTSLTNGFLINTIANYSINRYYTTTSPIKDFFDGIDLKTGLSYRFGIELSKNIGQKISINISPFLNYKLILDYYQYLPGSSFTDDRLSYGLIVGIGYDF